jgi:hypothetical protein
MNSTMMSALRVSGPRFGSEPVNYVLEETTRLALCFRPGASEPPTPGKRPFLAPDSGWSQFQRRRSSRRLAGWPLIPGITID